MLKLLFLVSFTVSALKADYEVCHPSREFVTTHNFLKKNKEFNISDKEARELAFETSKHCGKSSKNFIQAITLFNKIGIDTKSSIETAKELLPVSEKVFKQFIQIFKFSYESKFLDLSALDALSISRAALPFIVKAKEGNFMSFKEFLLFCHEELAQTSKICASFAQKVLAQSDRFEKNMFPTFKKLYEFLQISGKGPRHNVSQALEKSIELIEFGPSSADNYAEAYKYAVSNKGLKMGIKPALDFAHNMTKNSVQLKTP